MTTANCSGFWPAASQKCSRWDRVSSVVPDLEEATKNVRATSIDSCSRRIAFGWVVSRTWKLAASKLRRKTSGARLDPPIPSRT